MLRALIADDHPLFRNALSQVLVEHLQMQVDQAQDYASTYQMMEGNIDYDVVFLDLNMPDGNGLAGLVQVKNRFPNTLVVLVSAEENHAVINKALRLGVSGFIPKSAGLDMLQEAVSHVLDGNTWLPSYLKDMQASDDNADYIAKLGLLTPHQLKVLDMMANGLLNKQIAYELNISESTVKQHASAVLKKLGLYNRTQAGVIYKQIMQISSDSIDLS